MNNTKRSRKSGTRKHVSTINGLTKWYTHLFETLGWMVLAKENKMTYKVDTYIKSIRELCKHLRNRIEVTTAEDIKMDLKTMLDHTEVLMATASKWLE